MSQMCCLKTPICIAETAVRRAKIPSPEYRKVNYLGGSMRTVLLVATLLLAFGSIESRMTLAQLRNTVKGMKKVCTSKIAVSAEILEGASNGIYPPDPALQCYYKCIFEMMKLMKNDKLLIDVMIKQLDKMVALDVLDRMKQTTLKCAEEIDSEDPCVLSWQFTKCFYETDSSVVFFP